MSNSKKREFAFILAVIAAFCGGSVPVFGKIALQSIPLFTVVFIRFFITTLFLYIFVAKSLPKKNHKPFFAVGFFGALNPILFFIALPFTQASIAPLIYAAVPGLTTMYFFLASNDRPSIRQIMGLIIGFVGVGFIVLLPLFEKSIPLIALKGNFIMFLGMLGFTVWGILSKKQQYEKKVSPLILTFYFSLATMLMVLPMAAFEFLSGQIIPSQIGAKHILSVLELAVLGTGMQYVLYQYALSKSSALTASLFTYLQPVTTIILAVPILHEKITISLIVGGILAILGARLAAK